MSRQTISTITDKVVEGMAEWGEPATRPGLPGDLHRRHPCEDPRREGGQPADLRQVIFGALAVTAEGRRDILGLWAGEAPVGGGTTGEGAKTSHVP